jgi:hypothetical protein
MNASPSIKELATALAKAQGEFVNPNKNMQNPHFKNWYADLAEVLNTIRPVLAKHGLSVLQCPSTDGDRTEVETILMHESGEYISSKITCRSSKDGQAQGLGSDITYLRRYSLAGIGVAQEDLDGEITPNELEAGILQKLRDGSLLGKAAFDIAWQTIPKSPIKDKVWNAHKESLIAACLVSDNETMRKAQEFEKESIDIEIELAKEQA